MKPDFAIINERKQDGFTVVTVDTSQATYQGHAWRAMGDFGKRKFENYLVITRAPERLRIIYA